MIPLPNSRVFRSRWRAAWWAVCVIASALLFVGVDDPPKSDHPATAHQTDALGQPVDDKAVRDLMKSLEGR